ncbi:cation:proton antiporter [Rhodohalobacter sp. 8-1]|uniref:cation:proton antiporter n=1 Tax=Rhodohalobacter sp. 8-1 TaxID=3131972 RepID=UPI0030EEAA65
MTESILIGITSVIFFGVGAQWVGWKFKLPAILLLLLSGLLAGPVLGLVKPDQLMGDLLTPFINVSVAIILFEGGLSLKFSELKNVGGAIGNLVSIGALLTWVLTSLSAYVFFGFGWELAVLLGAILIVTGPTVIVPLLRQVRPSGQVGSILKWEGIVIDPIGAMIAVLVYEVILTSGFSEATSLAFMSIFKTILFGSVLGLAGAGVLYALLKKHLLPDFLQNPVSLMIVVLIFTISDIFQHESGLWATTLMGVVLANQKAARIHHIIEFKENIRLLLLSALFILLAARVELANLLGNLNLNMMAFLAVLIFAIRPAAVYLSTIFSPLSWKEKLFLCWMAPRGVVAASISSIFAISLVQNGYPEANQLISIVFITIIITVAIYGLTAPWIARKLGVAKPVPRGFLIIGAQDWAIDIAKELEKYDVKVTIADSNWNNISNAKSEGLETFYGDVLSEYALDRLNLDGIGKLLSVTPNDEVNALTVIRFSELFGRSLVYKLPPGLEKKSVDSDDKEDGILQTGRTLFDEEANYDSLTQEYQEGKVIKSTQLTEKFTFQNFKETHGEDAIPLFLVTDNKSIRPFTTDNPPDPQPGNILISMVNPAVDAEKKPEKTTEEKQQEN